MSFHYRLSPKSTNGKHEIMLRVVEKQIHYRAKTNIFIHPEIWDEKKEYVRRMKFGNPFYDEAESTKKLLAETEEKIKIYYRSCQGTPKSWLIDFFTQEATQIPSKKGKQKSDELSEKPQQKEFFMDIFHKFIKTRPVSQNRIKAYVTTANHLQKFEKHRRRHLDMLQFTADTLREFERFLKNTIDLADNTVTHEMKIIRTFMKEMHKRGKIQADPFDNYTIKSEKFGSVTYITIDERETLYKAELPPHIAVQRDIFIFQCLIGCRVGDLLRMTKSNIVNGAIEYIAQKTDDRPNTIHVPLSKTALEILSRYQDTPDNKLLPFISSQKYNDAIKEAFRLAGLTRTVTIRDSHTGKDTQVQICDIASSHMARRTFIANLYKQVKDPSLIGKLSGHSEGSKAFVRYREIDEDLMKETINLLEK